MIQLLSKLQIGCGTLVNIVLHPHTLHSCREHLATATMLTAVCRCAMAYIGILQQCQDHASSNNYTCSCHCDTQIRYTAPHSLQYCYAHCYVTSNILWARLGLHSQKENSPCCMGGRSLKANDMRSWSIFLGKIGGRYHKLE